MTDHGDKLSLLPQVQNKFRMTQKKQNPLLLKENVKKKKAAPNRKANNYFNHSKNNNNNNNPKKKRKKVHSREQNPECRKRKYTELQGHKCKYTTTINFYLFIYF